MYYINSLNHAYAGGVISPHSVVNKIRQELQSYILQKPK
jgi:hypothetical protein